MNLHFLENVTADRSMTRVYFFISGKVAVLRRHQCRTTVSRVLKAPHCSPGTTSHPLSNMNKRSTGLFEQKHYFLCSENSTTVFTKRSFPYNIDISTLFLELNSPPTSIPTDPFTTSIHNMNELATFNYGRTPPGHYNLRNVFNSM